MNLLTRLNHFAHRQDENFLTEAFVYLLEFLLGHEQAAAVKILNHLTAGHAKIVANDCSSITISTQISTTEGRPDIEIRTPTMLVYIEVKAESCLGVQQIKRYRTALRKSGYENTFLCLLTRYPVENESDDEEPDLHLRWMQIYEFLDRINVDGDVSKYVLKQFMGFLEEKGIVMEHVSWQLIDGVKSMQNLLNMLGQAIDNNSIKTKPISGGKQYIGYYFDDNRNWIGINYSDPANLMFVIEKTTKKIDKNDMKKCGFKEDQLDNDKKIYVEINLADEENHFFSRDKTSQLRFLEKLVSEWRKKEQKFRSLGY